MTVLQSFTVFHNHDTLKEYQLAFLYTLAYFGFGRYCLLVTLRWCIFSKNVTEVVWPSQYDISGEGGHDVSMSNYCWWSPWSLGSSSVCWVSSLESYYFSPYWKKYFETLQIFWFSSNFWPFIFTMCQRILPTTFIMVVLMVVSFFPSV